MNKGDNENFVSFKQAVKLKDLGFDWKCLHFYHSDGVLAKNHRYCHDGEIADIDYILKSNNKSQVSFCCIDAPTLAEAQKWLREVKDWDVIVIPKLAKFGKKKYGWLVSHWSNPEISKESCSSQLYKRYELALAAGINIALKLIEDT